MKTVKEWNRILASHTPHTYASNKVEIEARLYLGTLEGGEFIATNTLVEALYPRAEGDKNLINDRARSRIYTIVGKLAREGKMGDCCMKGEQVPGKQYMGHKVAPWFWFNNGEEMQVCGECGQLLIQKAEDEDDDTNEIS